MLTRILRRRRSGEDTKELASHATLHAHAGVTTTIFSAIALLFSAFSLWETSLKQANLSVYVTGVVSYGRDTTDGIDVQPAGGFEVLAVPVTIANGGARDAAVLSLQLDVSNPQTGLTARFEGTYTADAAYFAATGAKRPKAPFSALVIPGRSAWTGTVLFYPVSYSNGKSLTPVVKVAAFNEALRKKYAEEMGGSSSISILREKLPNLPELAELDAYSAKVLNKNDKVEVSLKLVSPAPSTWLDRLLGAPVRPVTLTLEMPNVSGQRLENDLVRLRSAAAGS
jgi:hypothetical protein